ncbi:MAG: hypothetical protein PGN34_20035 [Methylobacterium frigidaeris]
MRYDHANRQNRMRAGSLLHALKDKLVDASGASEKHMTMQAATSSPHWRISNVAGVHVYQVEGGWHADLAFKDLPSGVPAIIGTAVPVATRREALESAVNQLSLCVEREKTFIDEVGKERLRYFVFDEVEVPVDPDYLPDVRARLAREGYTAEEATGRLAYLRHVISGDEPVTSEACEATDHETRTSLVIACEIAMALGRTQFTPEDGTWADYMPTVPGMM